MGVSRAGFYKWKNRDSLVQNVHRDILVATIEQVHKDHRTHGYRWVAAFIRINYTFGCSDSYAYKIFRFLGIKSETKHQVHHRPRKVKDKYPNLIYSTWDTVDRPRQVIVSDMTTFHIWCFYIEVTFYFDVFTKQILAWKLAERRGSRDQYIEGLKDIVGMLKGCSEPVILHSDQGTVYASLAYNELIQDSVIVRSMSRAGKPTDNPVNEALNGWIKEELYMDFRLDACRRKEEILAVFTRYVAFYNAQRPCYAIGYDTPDNYDRRFKRGELPAKDTFRGRILSETPKFVQKKKAEPTRVESRLEGTV
jgi:transposase InsO family protein